MKPDARELRRLIEARRGEWSGPPRDWEWERDTKKLADAAPRLLARIERLKRSLLEAASRFQDIADEMDTNKDYRDTGFLKASAKRFKNAALAEGASDE